MFEAKRIRTGAICEYTLEGVIDENVYFLELSPGSGNALRLNCKAIKRINSAGIRNWVVFFESLRKKQVQVKFAQLSPAMVEQINFIPQLALIHEIESLGILFACGKCDSTLVRYFTPEQAMRLDRNRKDVPCPSCDHPMDYDEDPEETLSFLRR